MALQSVNISLEDSIYKLIWILHIFLRYVISSEFVCTCFDDIEFCFFYKAGRYRQSGEEGCSSVDVWSISPLTVHLVQLASKFILTTTLSIYLRHPYIHKPNDYVSLWFIVKINFIVVFLCSRKRFHMCSVNGWNLSSV